MDVLSEIEHHVRVGIDQIKLRILMEASLLEGFMSAEYKTKLAASIKEAFEFVVNKPDKMFEKVKYHMVVVSQMLMLSNAPCSHRHFTSITQIIDRLL